MPDFLTITLRWGLGGIRGQPSEGQPPDGNLTPLEGLEDTGMPVLCPEPLHKPQCDHSLCPPLSELISMASCQGGPPSLPVLHGVVERVPKALWLGPPAAGSSQAHSGPGSAQSPECAQGPQRGHPCSPSSTPPICCHLRRHMLQLHTQKTPHAHFGGQWLPASQAGGENKMRGK